MNGGLVEGQDVAVQDWPKDCIDAILLKAGVQRKDVDNVLSLSLWSVTQLTESKVENQLCGNGHGPDFLKPVNIAPLGIHLHRKKKSLPDTHIVNPLQMLFEMQRVARDNMNFISSSSYCHPRDN